jgi:hypothetical protein
VLELASNSFKRSSYKTRTLESHSKNKKIQ